MKTCETLSQFFAQRKALSGSIGFVPTMGALHDGHISLVKAARKQCDVLIASIFVNPTQFGPNEDLDKYPRPIENDMHILREHGCDILLAPSTAEIYPQTPSIEMRETHFSQFLCGAHRPGHFDGVLQIVSKLLHIVSPTDLFMGQKDAQQVRIVSAMLKQLNFPTALHICPTSREKSGLALSSRNQFLNSEDKKRAASLYAGLQLAHKAFIDGERDRSKVEGIAKNHIEKHGIELQYLEVRTWRSFTQEKHISERSLLALAAFVGQTRLIDNVMLELEQK